VVYSTRLESVRAQALVGPNPTSSASWFIKYITEGSPSGLGLQFTKLPYRKIPRVRIPPPPPSLSIFTFGSTKSNLNR
jgi:hypothetical protein